LWCEVVDIYTVKGQLPKIFENDVKILHVCRSFNYVVCVDYLKQNGIFTDNKPTFYLVKCSRNSSCIRWL